MSKKISELTAAGALTGSELVEVVQGGTNKRTTAQDIADLGGGGSLLYYEQTITSAEILTANSSPVEIIAAPGANQCIIPFETILSMDFNTTPYATNLLIDLRVGSSGVTYLNDLSGFLSASADIVYFHASLSVAFTAGINQPLQFFIPNGNPTAGDSDIKIRVFYKVITL